MPARTTMRKIDFDSRAASASTLCVRTPSQQRVHQHQSSQISAPSVWWNPGRTCRWDLSVRKAGVHWAKWAGPTRTSTGKDSDARPHILAWCQRSLETASRICATLNTTWTWWSALCCIYVLTEVWKSPKPADRKWTQSRVAPSESQTNSTLLATIPITKSSMVVLIVSVYLPISIGKYLVNGNYLEISLNDGVSNYFFLLVFDQHI